jgi:hypothetical protein
MANQAYVVDTGGENYIIMIANHRPPGAIAISPLEDGEQVTDISWLDILDVDDGFGNLVKTPIVNPGKKASALAGRQAAEDARAAADQARQDRVDALKALNPGNLTTLPQIRDTLLEVMDLLGMR